MASLVQVNRLHKTYSHLATFCTIYTLEAHPTEAEEFKNFVDIKIHRSIEDRLEAAKTLERVFLPHKLEGHLLADQLDDAAVKAYGAFPDRLYIVQNGTVVYQGEQGPFGYKISEVEEWLKIYEQKIE